jgi:hypothetical protein
MHPPVDCFPHLCHHHDRRCHLNLTPQSHLSWHLQCTATVNTDFIISPRQPGILGNPEAWDTDSSVSSSLRTFFFTHLISITHPTKSNTQFWFLTCFLAHPLLYPSTFLYLKSIINCLPSWFLQTFTTLRSMAALNNLIINQVNWL